MDIRFVIAFPRVGSGRLPVSAQQYPLLSEPHRLPASVITSYEGEEFFAVCEYLLSKMKKDLERDHSLKVQIQNNTTIPLQNFHYK